MKLYTEFELKRAMDLLLSPIRPLKSQVIQQLTPIELPSDEEIKEAITNYNINEFGQSAGFIAGAKWMKEQILNQNK